MIYLSYFRNFVKHQTTHVATLPAYLKEGLPEFKDSENALLSGNVIICSDTDIKSEIVDIEEVSVSDWCSVESDQASTSQIASKTREPVGSKRKLTESKSIQDDADASFFKGILPDVARMSSHQKLKFKQEALSIIEDILYATEDIDITE